MASQIHIVALGSSFAAGASIKPISDAVTNRSSRNYTSLVAQELGARLTDLSASGATLLNVLNEPQQFLSESRPAQLDGLPSDADIVTLTAGGNDMGYSAQMISDACEVSRDEEPALSSFIDYIRTQLASRVTAEEVTARFVNIIDAVKQRAPQATIYLVEYLAIFNESSHALTPSIPFDDAKLRHHLEQAEKLRLAYVEAAHQRPGTRLVEVAHLSLAHALDSASPWVTHWEPSMLLTGETPYHPNALGHETVAKLLLQRISEDK